jgi:hypothetical protein
MISLLSEAMIGGVRCSPAPSAQPARTSGDRGHAPGSPQGRLALTRQTVLPKSATTSADEAGLFVARAVSRNRAVDHCFPLHPASNSRGARRCET